MTAKRTWVQDVLDEGGEVKREEGLEAFTLYTATTKQTGAMRSLARDWGFKDLRDYRAFMMEVGKTYYDLIKMASPE